MDRRLEKMAFEYVTHPDFDPLKVEGNHATAWAVTCRVLTIKALGACQDCGKRGKRLSVHHIDGCALNNSLDNLIAVCPNCHGRYHKQSGEDAVKQAERIMGLHGASLKNWQVGKAK